MSWFIAAFDSDCGNCSEPIEKGQTAVMEDGVAVHMSCPPPRRESPVCPQCHLAHAGECW